MASHKKNDNYRINLVSNDNNDKINAFFYKLGLYDLSWLLRYKNSILYMKIAYHV